MNANPLQDYLNQLDDMSNNLKATQRRASIEIAAGTVMTVVGVISYAVGFNLMMARLRNKN